jgi:hypothetical protein
MIFHLGVERKTAMTKPPKSSRQLSIASRGWQRTVCMRRFAIGCTLTQIKIPSDLVPSLWKRSIRELFGWSLDHSDTIHIFCPLFPTPRVIFCWTLLGVISADRPCLFVVYYLIFIGLVGKVGAMLDVLTPLFHLPPQFFITTGGYWSELIIPTITYNTVYLYYLVAYLSFTASPQLTGPQTEIAYATQSKSKWQDKWHAKGGYRSLVVWAHHQH